MSFAAPAWLALLALAPLIVALHLRRPRELTVSSLFIWRRISASIDEAEGGTGAKVDWPLLLQLSALTMLALALSEPRFGEYARVDHAVYVVVPGTEGAADHRESSRAHESWWDAIRREARALPTSATVTVLEAAGEPRYLAVRERAGPGFKFLTNLTADDSPPSWTSAFDAIRAVVTPGENVMITVLGAQSEGPAIEAAFARSALDDASLELRLSNITVWSVGIVGGRILPDDASGGPSIVAQVAGRSEDAAVRVEVSARRIDSESFEVVDEARVDVQPGRVEAVPFTLDLDDVSEVRLQAVSGEGPIGKDLVLPAVSPPSRVLVVGPVSQNLGRALQAVPDIEVFVSDRLPIDMEGYVLVVITDASISEVPTTSTVWLGSFPGGGRAFPDVDQPEVSGWSETQRIAPGDWFGLRVERAKAVPVLDGATVIVESGGLPLIQLRATDRGFQVVTAFAPDESNWPSLSTFPVFFDELVNAVAPPERRGGYTACTVGLVCRLGAEYLQVGRSLTLPDGSTWPNPTSLLTVSDAFAGGYWPLAGAELNFLPQVPGTYGVGGRGGQPVVVASSPPGWGAELGTPVPASEGDTLPGRGQAPPVDLTALFLGATMVLVGANLVALWRRRIRYLRSRAWWVLSLTLVAIAGLAAAWIEVPLPGRDVEARIVYVSDERSDPEMDGMPLTALSVRSGTESSVDVAGEGQTIGATSFRSALRIASGFARGGTVRVAARSGSGPSTAEVAHLVQSGTLGGARFDHLATLPASGVGAVISGLELPERVTAGSPTQFLLTLHATTSEVWRLRVLVGDTSALDADLEVYEGVNILRVPLTVESSGDQVLTIIVEGEDGTAVDEARASLLVESAERVIVVGSDAIAANHLVQALELQGLRAVAEAPLNLPWSVDGWVEWDTVVLLDLPAHALHSVQLDALESWVSEAGGGLVILGGETSFGPGGYLRTPLDKLSPLSSQVPREVPEVTMLFVLDRSGSMQQAVGATTRMGIAKEATISAIELLGPGSRVGVIVYDSEAQVLVPITPVDELTAISRAVDSVRASGGTALHPALVSAAGLLEDVESAAIHVVVLTDGMSQAGDFRTVIKQLKDYGGTITFVGIGSGADRIQLRDLSSIAGGALHITDDVRALPSILAQEAMLGSEDLIARGRVELLHEPVNGDWTAPLPVSGYVGGYIRTEAKPGADVHYWTMEDEKSPVLASWRYGLGRVVAFTSHAIGAWADGWIEPTTFASSWSQVVRWAGATVTSGAETEVAVKADGLRLEATVRVPSQTRGDPSIPPFALTAIGVTDGANEGSDSYRATAVSVPIGDSAYHVSVELPRSGLYDVRVTDADGSDVHEGRFVVTDRPDASTGPGGLDALSLLTGGRKVTAFDSSATPSEGRIGWVRTRWPWAVTALAFFLASLLLAYGIPRAGDLSWTLRNWRDAWRGSTPAA